ncbi:MAG: hypothetical protein AAF710_08525 [Planctomycetota bacterium]
MKPWSLTAAAAAVALASVPATVGASAAEDRPIRLAVQAETLHEISPLLFGQFMEDAKHANGRGAWSP